MSLLFHVEPHTIACSLSHWREHQGMGVQRKMVWRMRSPDTQPQGAPDFPRTELCCSAKNWVLPQGCPQEQLGGSWRKTSGSRRYQYLPGPSGGWLVFPTPAFSSSQGIKVGIPHLSWLLGVSIWRNLAKGTWKRVMYTSSIIKCPMRALTLSSPQLLQRKLQVSQWP